MGNYRDHQYPRPQGPSEDQRQGPQPPRDVLEEAFTHFARQYISLLVGFGVGVFVMYHVTERFDLDHPSAHLIWIVVGYLVFRLLRGALYALDD